MTLVDRLMPERRRSWGKLSREERKLRGEGPLRILVVRPDRLGDVVLSTPVFECIKRLYPRAHLTALVQGNVLPILKGLSSVDHFLIYEPLGAHAGIRGFFRLIVEIRRRRYRIAVVLQSNWKVTAAVFFARVKYRVGPLSKLHSFLFFNRGMRQRRSHVEMHETDYNLQLLRKLGARVSSRQILTQIHVPEATQEKAHFWLKERGWNPEKDLILVHPGMGGSALNWPEAHYIQLILRLVEEGKQVLVTAGPTENALLEQVQKELGSARNSVMFYSSRPKGVKNGESIDFLAALCQSSQVVVAPSTGPLHLAVALKRPTVTFYPPIRVQSAVRWGPYVEDETVSSVLVPEVYCGQERECLGKACNYFPCMKGLTVNQALKEVHLQLERKPVSP